MYIRVGGSHPRQLLIHLKWMLSWLVLLCFLLCISLHPLIFMYARANVCVSVYLSVCVCVFVCVGRGGCIFVLVCVQALW